MTVLMALPTREMALAWVLPIILFNIEMLIADAYIVSFFKVTWELQIPGWGLSSPSPSPTLWMRCRRWQA